MVEIMCISYLRYGINLVTLPVRDVLSLRRALDHNRFSIQHTLHTDLESTEHNTRTL